MDEQDIENNNESFIHENNSLFKGMEDQSSIDMNISCNFQQEHPLSMTMNEESTEMLSRIRKNMVALKINKNINNTFIAESKDHRIFQVHHNIENTTNLNINNISNHKTSSKVNFNTNNQTNNTNNFNFSNSTLPCNMNNTTSNHFYGNTSASNLINIIYHNEKNTSNYHNQTNMSLEYKNNSCSNISIHANNNNCNNTNINLMTFNNLTLTTKSSNKTGFQNEKKRGRRRVLLDGFKTELLDKAFLREFKSYVKKTKALKILYDEISPEEKVFWNEFINCSSPPFTFTINRKKMEFKSYSKNLLNFIFSMRSVQVLYDMFIKDREMEVVTSLFNKRSNKKIDKMTFLYYSYYGKNLHKIYSQEDLDMDLIEGLHDYADSITNTSLGILETKVTSKNSYNNCENYTSSSCNNFSSPLNNNNFNSKEISSMYNGYNVCNGYNGCNAMSSTNDTSNQNFTINNTSLFPSHSNSNTTIGTNYTNMNNIISNSNSNINNTSNNNTYLSNFNNSKNLKTSSSSNKSNINSCVTNNLSMMNATNFSNINNTNNINNVNTNSVVRRKKSVQIVNNNQTHNLRKLSNNNNFNIHSISNVSQHIFDYDKNFKSLETNNLLENDKESSQSQYNNNANNISVFNNNNNSNNISYNKKNHKNISFNLFDNSINNRKNNNCTCMFDSTIINELNENFNIANNS
jgi:hypothetical protein